MSHPEVLSLGQVPFWAGALAISGAVAIAFLVLVVLYGRAMVDTSRKGRPAMTAKTGWCLDGHHEGCPGGYKAADGKTDVTCPCVCHQGGAGPASAALLVAMGITAPVSAEALRKRRRE